MVMLVVVVVVIVIAMVMLVVILVVAPEELDQSLNLFQKRSQAESANPTTSPDHLKSEIPCFF